MKWQILTWLSKLEDYFIAKRNKQMEKLKTAESATESLAITKKIVKLSKTADKIRRVGEIIYAEY